MKCNRQFFIVFLIIPLLCTSISFAQDIEELDEPYTEFWTDITFGKPLNDKWTVGGDLGFRTAFNNSNWKLFYVRPNINYKFFPFFDLTFGVGSFNTFSSDFSNTFEFRIYQDGNFTGPKLGFLNFSHRLRLEQRFFTFADDDIQDEFSFRGRYMLAARTDRFAMGGEEDWTVFMSLEPFFPLGKEVTEILANNFRWDTALSYQVSEGLRIELHYILQSSDIFSRNEFTVVEHIFRFRVFQKL